jgi:NAD(P) transhydrogenase
MSNYDLVVIGSGPAGQKAAICAAKNGKRSAIVEKSLPVGGVCLHQGTIPSKTLRQAVIYLAGLGQRELYGASYRVKDRISIEDLSYRTQRVIEQETNVVRDQLLRNYVDIISGTARFLSPQNIEVVQDDEIRKLKAEKVIIAVGSKPARPPNIQFDDRTVIDSDGLLKLHQIPHDLCVVGAGIIGAEYATFFQALGTRVTLIDGRERPLDFVDNEIEDALIYHLRDAGMTIRFGETVSQVSRNSSGRIEICLQSGKETTAEALLFSAGRMGATDVLQLEKVGLQADERGRLKVDQFYQTSVPNIYAVGDVVGFPTLASSAMEEGRIAACHAFGIPAAPMTSLLPYGVYTIPEISMVGPTEEDLTKQAIPYETGLARYRELARGQIMGQTKGLLKILFHRENLKLLAVHILGEQATELVHIGQAVMALNGTIEYFREAVFNYPTLAEAYKVAALNGFNKL